MFASTPDESRILKLLGRELLQKRTARKQRQADFAARMGISVPTYRRMERGSGYVPIAYWMRALTVLDTLKGFETVLTYSEHFDAPMDAAKSNGSEKSSARSAG